MKSWGLKTLKSQGGYRARIKDWQPWFILDHSGKYVWVGWTLVMNACEFSFPARPGLSKTTEAIIIFNSNFWSSFSFDWSLHWVSKDTSHNRSKWEKQYDEGAGGQKAIFLFGVSDGMKQVRHAKFFHCTNFLNPFFVLILTSAKLYLHMILPQVFINFDWSQFRILDDSIGLAWCLFRSIWIVAHDNFEMLFEL